MEYIIRDKSKGLYETDFSKYVAEKVKEEYNKKINKIFRNNIENFELLKVSLDLSRINILGFAIGNVSIKEIPITFDFSIITNKMYKIFEYLRIIFSNFNIYRLQREYLSLYNLHGENDLIWNPDDYKDIPYVADKKPENMSQEEYDILRIPNEKAINEIVNVKFVNWFKKMLNETLNSDGKDLDVANLEINTDVITFYFGTNTDYKEKIHTRFYLKFILNHITFTIFSGAIYWYNILP